LSLELFGENVGSGITIPAQVGAAMEGASLGFHRWPFRSRPISSIIFVFRRNGLFFRRRFTAHFADILLKQMPDDIIC